MQTPQEKPIPKEDVSGGLAGSCLLLQPADFTSDLDYRKMQGHETTLAHNKLQD